MPVHRFDGSQWSQSFARVWDGAWSDENDNMWAWDGSEWQLIQPLEAVGPGGLLPPENLTITVLGDHTVEITWTDPIQLTEDPTNVQYRIVEITSINTEVVYPTNIFSHDALFPETAYTFEVRYVRREGGEIVASSIVSSIPFVTLQLPVGDPAPGPPPLTTFPIRPPVNPGPVGGPGCWFEWKLWVWDDDGFGWIDTGITGTHAGTQANFHYDVTTLDASKMYRFEFCENCNGVLSPDGCNFGSPFPGGLDWAGTCGGMSNSASAANSIMSDAVWQIPKICTDAEGLVILDGVSGLEVAKGSSYGFYSMDAAHEWQLVNHEYRTGAIFNAPMPAMPLALSPGDDFSIMHRIRVTSAFVPASRPPTTTWWGGLAHRIEIHWGVASFSFHADFLLDDNSHLELDTDQYPYTPGTYQVILRWDHAGDAEFFVNGELEDTNPVGVGITSNVIQPYLQGGGVPGLTTAMHYGWARLLSDFEIGQIHEPSLTGWWGKAFTYRELYQFRVAGQRMVKLAGANTGGALVGTVPAGEYVVSIGSSGENSGEESWGFGGYGGQMGSSGNIDFSGPFGGGRSELRTGFNRSTAIVIAPGGAGAGGGGFPDGLPAAPGTPGGFGGHFGGGATATTPGLPGPGYAGAGSGQGNWGWLGDGPPDADQAGSGVGSGGRGGNGTNSFGSGGPGGGGGGGKHGGGGGSGGNGSSTSGAPGGGGSGDLSGLTTDLGHWNGANGYQGIAALQVLADYSQGTKDFIDQHNPVHYIPGEEARDPSCVVVTDVMSGKGFWDRHVATLFDGTVTGKPSYVQGQSLARGPAMHCIRVGGPTEDNFMALASEQAALATWHPPAFNAGQSWAVEWTGKNNSGTDMSGPGALNATAVGSYPFPLSTGMPWKVWAQATGVKFNVATTSMSTVVVATGAMPSRAVTLETRYGVSYNAATDTFHFYRSDGQTATVTRTAAGIPTTGQWTTPGWKPVIHCEGFANDVLLQDVAIFTSHRSQAQFTAGCTLLSTEPVGPITTATGGRIHRVGDEIWHEITASGTFDPGGVTRACTMMAVGAGGGQGGANSGYWPEGGAGGCVRIFSANISSPTAITIGAGGAPAPAILQSGLPGGATTIAGVGTAPGGGGGQPVAGVRGPGGNNADYNGSATAPSNNGGGGAGAGGNAPAGTTMGGPGREWPVNSGLLWGSGGGGGPDGMSGVGERGPNSGAGAHPYQQTGGAGRGGRVIIKYPA